jgi:hypothetical protein
MTLPLEQPRPAGGPATSRPASRASGKGWRQTDEA